MDVTMHTAPETTLPQQVIARLAARGATLCCAESCTGGLLSARLTDVPGCSAVLVGGFVTYCDRVKQELLGVLPTTLARCTAVSAEVAAEMARGARLRLGTSYALSLTGYAGPDGGTPDDPVGTVYIGISDAAGERVLRFCAPQGSDRATVRHLAAKAAMLLLLERLA